MRVGINLLLLWLLPVICFAQSAELDSLRALLRSSSGKEHVDIANEYAYVISSYDYKEALSILTDSYQKSKTLGYKKGMAEALMYQGIIQYNVGNDSLAIPLYKQSLKLCNEIDARQLKGRLLTSVGIYFQNFDQLDSAEHYYTQSYQLLKDSTNPLHLSYLYLNHAELKHIQNDSKAQLSFLNRSWEIRKNLKQKHPFVWAGVALASYYNENGDFKKALSYLDQSKKALEGDTIDSEEYAIINYQQGVIETNLGNHKKALRSFSLSKIYYEKNPYSFDYVNLLIEVGYTQSDVANYEISLKYYFQALKLVDQNHFERLRTRLYFRIAWVYYLMEHDALSEEFVNKTLASATKLNQKPEEASAYNLLGLLADRHKEFEKSISYYNRALDIRQKNNYRQGVASTLLNIGIAYENQGKFKKAEEFDLRSLVIEEELQHGTGMCYSYQSLGQLYVKMRNFQKAHNYLEKAERLSQEIAAGNILMDVYRNKRDLYVAQAKLEDALQYSLKFETLRDSILGKNVSNRVLTLQYDYELDQKENEIKILGQQKELQQARLNQQQQSIRQQRIIIAIIVILLLVFAGVAYVIFTFYRKVRSLNREISDRNEEITAQSEELREANEVLYKLNRETTEQKEEIQAQAEELTESNQTIARINEGLEEKIKVRTAELREAYQELDTFFYRSSHDFRRPLTTFMGLAEVAKVTVKDAMALELFNKVNETAHSLDKMLMKLQSISVIGSQELIYSEVLLKEILQVELDEFRDDMQSKQMEVKMDLNLKKPFHSYPALIKIIVQNLIENAIAFSALPHPLLKISAADQDEFIVLVVEDNGQGIDEIYQQRIFEMYFRANERSKGNGLGLYIVKKIVDKLKGTIEVKSKYGNGTTVTIAIPNHLV